MVGVSTRVIVGAAVLCVLAGTAAGHDGDIGLELRSGRLVTANVDETGPLEKVVGTRRVFGVELEDFLGVPFVSDPGMFGEPGAFPETGLGFDILGPLRWWDGAAFTMIAPSTLTIAKGPESRTTPGALGEVAGFHFPIGPAGFDEHYEFSLNPPADMGVYLVALRFWTTDPAIAASRDLFLVFNWGADEAVHDAAIAWTGEHLVPAPGVAVLALAGLGAAGGRRRVRRRAGPTLAVAAPD